MQAQKCFRQTKIEMVVEEQHFIPAQPTPFIGRDEELAKIIARINDPDCRLLTLVGFGGSGKSRLAVELANQTQNVFADGVYFVALQSVTSGDNLPSAIADAMQHVMRGHQEPANQLINYLRHKNCLLILDNFEHLISSVDYISDILASARAVKVVVTSREVLNLREEWLFPVTGMHIPEANNQHQLETYDAISLFIDHAKRIRPDFSLSADHASVIRICQLVEGLPLAIELATSWLKYMSCEQIAEDIVHSIDFLKTNLRNMPDRHQSMRAVVDQSWKLLTEEEQRIFKRLATFPGYFSRDAAANIADASLQTLSSLVDKSMLWSDADKRYKVHELLRQYAEEQLIENSVDYTAVQERFGAYYRHFLRVRRDAINRGNQIVAMSEIQSELENIRAVWQWAADHQHTDFFEQAVESLAIFYQFKSRYVEGLELMERVYHKMLDIQQPVIMHVLAKLELHMAWFLIRVGRLDEAEQLLLCCQKRHSQTSHPAFARYSSDPRIALGIIALTRGDYRVAYQYGQDARQTAEANHNLWDLSFAYNVMASVMLAKGDLHTAERYADEACRLAEIEGDRWSLAYPLNTRGSIARVAKKYDEASEYYQQSFHIRQEFDDPEGMAIALNASSDK